MQAERERERERATKACKVLMMTAIPDLGSNKGCRVDHKNTLLPLCSPLQARLQAFRSNPLITLC